MRSRSRLGRSPRKLTLFAAEGPREQGALKHVALAFICRTIGTGRSALRACAKASGSLVEAGDRRRVDLDHVALYSRDPGGDCGRVRLGSASPRPRRGPSGTRASRSAAPGSSSIPGSRAIPERPLLNHIAVLVDSADETIAAANDLGIEIDDIKDAANTYAVFLAGPSACASSTSSTSRRSP